MLKPLKELVERCPYSVGRWLARAPFSWRLGGEYARTKTECKDAEKWSDVEKEAYAVKKIRRIFEYARSRFPCYRKRFEEAGVLKLEIKTVSDIAKIPTIDKAWARAHFQEFHGAYRLNTGGSSGELCRSLKEPRAQPRCRCGERPNILRVSNGTLSSEAVSCGSNQSFRLEGLMRNHQLITVS